MFCLTASELLALLDRKPETFTAKSGMRLAATRKDGKIMYLIDDRSGPKADGAQEVDLSLMAKDDERAALLVQHQKGMMEVLAMIPPEIDEHGQVLTKIHETGAHAAFAGANDRTYDKDVAVMTSADAGKSWRYFDAMPTGLETFQPLKGGWTGVKVGDKLGVKPFIDVVAAVQARESLKFGDAQTMTVPTGATLPPRFVDKNGELVLAYAKDGKTTVGEVDEDGKITTREFVQNEDVVGKMIFAALDEKGDVTGDYGVLTLDVDTGKVELRDGLKFGDVFAIPTPA